MEPTGTARLEIRTAWLEDIPILRDNLRAADLAEVRAAGYEPGTAVGLSFAASERCWTALVDGQMGAMFGVRKQRTGHGLVWLLGTDKLEEITISFLRESKIAVDYLLNEYGGQLENVIHCNNALHIKYLKWLGAEFDTEYVTPLRPFMSFKIRRKNACASRSLE